MPGLYINLAHTASQVGVYAVIRKQTTTSLGDYWNDTAFVTSPAGDEEKLPVGEHASASGFYWADVAKLSTYTGWLSVVVYTSAGVAVSAENRYVSNGVENPFHIDTDTINVPDARVFRLMDYGDTITAVNQITLNDTDEATIAFDFSKQVFMGQILASVTGVVEETANAITIANVEMSVSRMRAHCHISGLTASTSTSLRATVVTTNGDTISGLGTVITV